MSIGIKVPFFDAISMRNTILKLFFLPGILTALSQDKCLQISTSTTKNLNGTV